MQEKQIQSLDGEDPLEEEIATHSSILAWESHGQRSLAGYSLWGLKESDMTEHAHKVFLRSLIAAAAKSLQLCPTLCNPRDGRPPGSPIPGILQARTLEWVSISFSKAWKWKVKVKPLSCVWLFATPWTVAHQAPPPMGFSRQEYWSGLPLPSHSYRYHLLIFEFPAWYTTGT